MIYMYSITNEFAVAVIKNSIDALFYEVEGGCLKLVRLDALPVPGCYNKAAGFLQRSLFDVNLSLAQKQLFTALLTLLKTCSTVILHTIYSYFHVFPYIWWQQ